MKPIDPRNNEGSRALAAMLAAHPDGDAALRKMLREAGEALQEKYEIAARNVILVGHAPGVASYHLGGAEAYDSTIALLDQLKRK